MPFDSIHFRRALGAFATGVTIVTTLDRNGTSVGMTANSFNSVSLNPPMVLWSLAKSSSNINVFREASSFAVHVLAADQQGLSGRFASKGVDRFAGLDLDTGEAGVPLLRDCAARFECRTAFQHEGGDHVILVGEVTDFTHSDRSPLVVHGGRYGRLLVRGDGSTPADPTGVGIGTLSPQDLLYHVARAYHHLRRDTAQERQRRQWSEAEYFTVAMLSMEGDISFEKLDGLVRHRGYEVTPEIIEALRRRGLVKAADRRLDLIGLTDAGRQAFIEVISIAKSAEADALKGFDHEEIELLRQLLQRVLPRPVQV